MDALLLEDMPLLDYPHMSWNQLADSPPVLEYREKIKPAGKQVFAADKS